MSNPVSEVIQEPDSDHHSDTRHKPESHLDLPASSEFSKSKTLSRVRPSPEERENARSHVIENYFRCMPTPDWKDRLTEPAKYHLRSLEYIISTWEIKKNASELEYAIEILGSNYKVLQNYAAATTTDKNGTNRSGSLWLVLSKALTDSEKYAKKIRHMVLKYIERNWMEYEESVKMTYKEELVAVAADGIVRPGKEFKQYSKLNTGSPLELQAAAELFKFDFCLIISQVGVGGEFFSVLNYDLDVTSLNIQERAYLTKFYILQTESQHRDPSCTYFLLEPTSSPLFLSPADGLYPSVLKKIYKIGTQPKQSPRTHLKLKPTINKIPPSSPIRNADTLLIFSYRQHEFLYKDLGILPQHSLFNILSELLYNSFVNGSNIKASLDRKWLQFGLQSPSLSVLYNKNYPGDEKYLDLASFVYDFNSKIPCIGRTHA